MSIFLRMYPGDAWALLIVNVLVQVTVVILAAWLLARLSNRWNAAWRHTVYLVALVGVLASPLLSSIMQANGVALATLRLSAPAVLPAEPKPAPTARAPESGPVETLKVSQITASRTSLDTESLGQSPQHEKVPSGSFFDSLRVCAGAASATWLLGMTLLLARWCHGLYLIAVVRRAAQPLDTNAMPELLHQVRHTLGADRLPPMATSDGLDRPIMVGLLRPLVILPEDVLRTLREPELADILVHECAHAVRRHQFAGFFQRLVGILFWWHPLVHVLNRELTQAREEVCDNYVLCRGNAPRYVRTLLELSQLLVDMPPQPATLGLFHCHWRLEDRVADLLDRRRRAMIRVNLWAIAGLTTVFLVPVLLMAGTRIAQAAPPQVSHTTAGSLIPVEKAIATIESLEDRIKVICWKAHTVMTAKLANGYDSNSVTETKPVIYETQAMLDPAGRRYCVVIRQVSEWLQGAAPFIGTIYSYSFDGKTYRAWQRSRHGQQLPTDKDPAEGFIAQRRDEIGIPSREADWIRWTTGTDCMPPYFCGGRWDDETPPCLLSQTLRKWVKEKRDISIAEDKNGVWTISTTVKIKLAGSDGSKEYRNLLRLCYDPTKGGVVVGAVWLPLDENGHTIVRDGRQIEQQRMEIELQKVNDALWAPKTVKYVLPLDKSMNVVAFDEVQVNVPVDRDTFRVKFPNGTQVNDEIRKMLYVIGKPTDEEAAGEAYMRRHGR